MVAEQIRARGIRDERVLAALERVPRECFIPENLRHEAHRDYPVPIGHGQAGHALGPVLAQPDHRHFPHQRRVRIERLDVFRRDVLAVRRHDQLLQAAAQVEAAVSARFGTERVRFRSSSNSEDLPNFNGAGLHTSTSAELGDPERTVANALRVVWSSLWNTRAYEERLNAGIRSAPSARCRRHVSLAARFALTPS